MRKQLPRKRNVSSWIAFCSASLLVIGGLTGCGSATNEPEAQAEASVAVETEVAETRVAEAPEVSLTAPTAPEAKTAVTEPEDPARRLEVLFLGDSGHHQPAKRAVQLIPPMLDRNIAVTYTEDVERALTRDMLDRYDALLMYGNIEQITDAQAEALLGYVEDGGGFVPIHSAVGSFSNQPEIIALMGAQFLRHGDGVFKTTIVEPEHPVMEGLEPIESWDETYEHTKHNEENRTVLALREEEPYTWVRTHGEGRVFYTAWGHDHRTWSNAGFHDLIERGIRWVAGQDVQESLALRTPERPFEFFKPEEAHYPPQAGQSIERDRSMMQKPLSPEESMKRIIVPAGFELELYAAEPDITKPIAMAFDEQGRVWISETVDYPNGLGRGRDRIKILEDTDNDGKADKFTIFAENLTIPTSLTFANGGLIVHSVPDTLFLKDTDGDDKADVRKVLFTGWGTGDTHAGPSNLHYGLDNWIYGSVGYSGFRGTVGGEEHRHGASLYRFRPDGSAIEFVAHTSNNTWGLAFSEDGGVFGSTANNNPSVHMAIPRRAYEGQDALSPAILPPLAATSRILPITDKVRQVDVVGGFTAASGHSLYTARAWPKPYWNRIAFVSGPTAHLVGEFVLSRDGSGFSSVHPSNIFASDDEWVSPIVAEVGPDGQLWIIDWYNMIVQHNSYESGHNTGKGNAYISELRDKRHGRIYRVVYKGSDPYEPITLEGADAENLVNTLRNDNMLWRSHAQRLLVERGETDVVPALVELVNDTSVDEIGLNTAAIHALWTLHGLGALDGSNAAALAAAKGALEHPSADVRRNAAAVLPATEASVQAILAAGLLEDEDLRTRLGALLALVEMPVSQAAGEALFAVQHLPEFRDDRWLQDAFILAASRHEEGFFSAAEAAGKLEAIEMKEGPNLLPNPSFEDVAGNMPTGWRVRHYNGQANHAVVAEGRNGGNAVKITSVNGADTALMTEVELEPRRNYRLSAWIKTENVSGATGGLININGVNDSNARTPAVTGTSDWKRVQSVFNSGNGGRVTPDLLMGGWGQSKGTVWFDDVSLVDIDPEDESLFMLASIRRVTGRLAAKETESDADADAMVIEIGVVPDVMKFATDEITVPAGEKIKIVFKNTDHMQHNIVFVAPGSVERVGALADKLILDPNGMAQHYVPDSPDVLASSVMVNPGETYEVVFTAPSEPGEYPFICTFPGHWRIMQGVMIVE